MATKGQNYAVGIGTGAAGGAAAGSVFGPWGTAIGAGVGAIGGAIEGAVANSEEAKQLAVLEAEQRRRKKEILYNVLRDQAHQYGAWGDTSLGDTIMAENDANWQNTHEYSQFAAQHRINPNSFVSMAQNGLAAAGRTYNGLNAQSSASPTYPSDFQLTKPSVLNSDAAEIGADEVLPTNDYQLRPYNPARFLRQDI